MQTIRTAAERRCDGGPPFMGGRGDYNLRDDLDILACGVIRRARRKVATGIAESVWRKRAQTKEVHSPIGHAGWAPDNATTGWEPALQNSQYFSMTGYHWRIWVPLLVIVSLFAAVACVGEDNIETTAKPILTPRSLPSPVPAVPTPTPGPIQVPTPRPSPTPAVSADSNNSTVEVAGKLVQAPVPTSTPAPTAVPPPTVLPRPNPLPKQRPRRCRSYFIRWRTT